MSSGRPPVTPPPWLGCCSEAALGDGNVVVAGVPHLLYGNAHRLGSQELSLLDVHHAARVGGSDQQFGLAAQESGNLQHVNIFGGDIGLDGLMDVGHYGDIKRFAHLAQDAQRLLVTDAGERIHARAVGFAVTALEHVGDVECLGDLHRLLGNVQCHLLALDHTGTGQQEEVVCWRCQ